MVLSELTQRRKRLLYQSVVDEGGPPENIVKKKKLLYLRVGVVPQTEIKLLNNQMMKMKVLSFVTLCNMDLI